MFSGCLMRQNHVTRHDAAWQCATLRPLDRVARDGTIEPRRRNIGMREKLDVSALKIRKLLTIVETTTTEMGRAVEPPTRKAAALAAIENPLAGRDSDDLSALIDIGEELGGLLSRMAVSALGITPAAVESYGKAAIVGEQGELEHAAAILHPKLGKPFRAAVEKGAALIPSAKKMGGPGPAIDVPLGHKDAAFVRSHFDAMEVRMADAPRSGEIVVALAVTDSGRPRARVGGLSKNEIVGKDGLR
jgi:hypothetical protein